ncbi:MAG: hypothetical protein QXR58_00905 [Candidatus Micrarchaeaceae archaeon]
MADRGEEQATSTAVALQYLSKVYEDRYSEVATAVRNTIEEIEDLSRAEQMLSDFDSIKGRHMLAMASPILAINAILGSEEKVLVEVGGGYIVEKSIEEGKQFLSSVIESRNKYLSALTKEKEQLESALLEISYKLSQEQDSYV